ncbi:MAG: DNA translocase FtsK 4TM domain-containing protein [Brachymonas sp.]|mgnify:FL=1|nr:DNA translocase FtsK 4TM domain-containing protein [Brachymonas sp.]MBP6966451.1 DNA translocase FtsK 4TM domain-containing protein [Brachymonas sp.]MBP7247323.1 DNA translocase FtsK 4TM domain-containing protein [Brachymonas sp.]MBP7724650.1 DNA translocase FtsK 4TM domain-containing protein [Brachymonas sp.]MBP7734046.1 DNA translocase FtsK 4TM domain-containing protein [Brachymonas sp.]
MRLNKSSFFYACLALCAHVFSPQRPAPCWHDYQGLQTVTSPFLIRNAPASPEVQDKPLLPKFITRFGQEVSATAALLLLLFWAAALISYSPADAAWSTTGTQAHTSNWLGTAGAWVADISYFVFGRSVWVLFAALLQAWLLLLRQWMHARQAAATAAHAAAPAINTPAGKPSTPAHATHTAPRTSSLWQRIRNNRLLWYCALVLLLLGCCGLEWSRLYTNAHGLSGGAGGVIGALAGTAAMRLMGFTASGVAGIVLVLGMLAWVFHFSWLDVAQKLGSVIDGWFVAARTRREEAQDFAAGQEAARQREAVVQQELEQIQEKPAAPIVIEIPTHTASAAPSARVVRESQHNLFADFADNQLPAIHLLDAAPAKQDSVDHETLEMTSRLIEKKLKDFGVEVRVVAAMPGPVVTRYEIEPATGVKGSQIVNLARDLARSLSLVSIRVIETIPGKNLMALELPNARRQTIRLSEILGSTAYHEGKSLLTMGLGKDIIGQPVVADLAKMPHVLVAGTTGSGKSVGINAMILSLLYKATAEQVRLLMIDPKMLEMSVYEGIPHLIAPVVTDMRQAAHGLNWCVMEMERRYKLMSKLAVRNLAGYNARIADAQARGEHIANPFSLTPDAPEPLERLPHLVIVIDELADLMMVVGKKIEELIARLAQKARAAGIHLILATQRPSVDVITGLIKANIPTRIAFQVSSKIDSRTILDQMGAESLLGMGDMLYLPAGSGLPTRIHGAFVSDEEVIRVVAELKKHGEPNYIEGILEGGTVDGEDSDLGNSTGGSSGDKDPMYDQAVEIVLKNRKASISLVQRHLSIGYQRSARLVEEMEKAGLVSPMGRNGQREILVPKRDE